VAEILAGGNGQTVYEIAGKLFGAMREFHVVLGCAEAEAHLEWLVDEGQAVDEAGRYRAAEHG
jgi:hypothetical protein